MYDEIFVSFGNDIKEALAKIKEENAKHHADGYGLVETISLGKVGCILIYFTPDAVYEPAAPLTTDPDEIGVEGDPKPPHTA